MCVRGLHVSKYRLGTKFFAQSVHYFFGDRALGIVGNDDDIMPQKGADRFDHLYLSSARDQPRILNVHAHELMMADNESDLGRRGSLAIDDEFRCDGFCSRNVTQYF